jgi:hypothetical protein
VPASEYGGRAGGAVTTSGSLKYSAYSLLNSSGLGDQIKRTSRYGDLRYAADVAREDAPTRISRSPAHTPVVQRLIPVSEGILR